MYKGMRKCIHEIRESTGKQKSPLRKEKLTNIKYQIVQYASQVGEDGKRNPIKCREWEICPYYFTVLESRRGGEGR